MRKCMLVAMVAGLLLASVAEVSAQRPQRGQRGQRGLGGRGGFFQAGRGMSGPAALLSNPSVQKELGLDDGQLASMGEMQQAMRNSMREAFSQLQGTPREEMREKLQELMQETNTKVMSQVEKILKPDQMKRLKQINFQQIGILGYGNSKEMQAALKLSDDQTEKLKQIREDTQADVRELMQSLRGGGRGGDRNAFADLRKKSEALRTEAKTEAMDLLTSEQKTAWKELTGKPFTIERQPRRRQDQDR